MNRVGITLILTLTFASIATADDNDQCSSGCLQDVIDLLNRDLGDGDDGGNQELLNRIASLEEKVENLQRDNEEIKSTCCSELTPEPTTPVFTSCESIKNANPGSPSGNYDIMVNGETINVYCNMDNSLTACGSTGGWTRVGYLNMQESQQCPLGLRLWQEGSVKACGRSDAGCHSIKFPSVGSYSQVCGRIIGFQKGESTAFWTEVSRRGYPYKESERYTVDDNYVDGVSITRGESPRKHIWSYAVNAYENRDAPDTCGCSSAPGKSSSPAFVGNDYYCESGIAGSSWGDRSRLYINDVLWDGEKCQGYEESCCNHPNMPWFKKDLGETTTDQIELRLCNKYSPEYGEVPLCTYEIYVK